MKIIFLRSLTIVLLFSFFYSNSQTKENSLLYEISGNGLQKPSYVYGTMHVSKKVAFRLSDQFFNSIKKCDLVALESNPEGWLPQMKDYGLFDDYDYRTADMELSNNDFYTEAFKFYLPTNQNVAGLLGYNPDIINELLFRNSSYQQNFEENTYIDLFIYQTANKWNKSVVSLENIKTSLFQAKLSTLLDNDREENEIISGGTTYDISKLEDAYREGNIDEIDKISRANGRSKNFTKYILDDRSLTFANSIDSIIKLNKSLFSGVGAAHLGGENGLLELLRRKGYKVTAVKPVITPFAAKTKAEIEAIVKPIGVKKFFAEDSLFSYMAPDKLVTITNVNGIEIGLYPEMVNGIYYSIFRFKTYANFNSYSANDYFLKIDSLLYENIPGKILKKTQVTNSLGHKGYSITSSTKKGDVLNYLIYVTNTEVIIFKIGATELLSKSIMYSDFLKSIQFYPNSKANKPFTPATGGFKVDSYTDHFYEKFNPGNIFGISERYFTYKQENNSFNGMLHAYYYDFEKMESDTSELNLICNKFINNLDEVSDLTKEISYETKCPQLNFSLKGNKKYVDGKVLIVGCNYYLVFTMNATGHDKAFVNSFKFTPHKYINPIRRINDNDLFFSAKDELTSDSITLNRDSYKMYKKIRAVKDTVKATYLSDYSSKAYFSPSTGERVNIEMWKYNDYDYVNELEFADKLKKNYKAASFTMSGFTKSKKNNENVLEFYLQNHTSSKKLKSICYVKNGLCYAVTVAYDSIIGIPEWSNNFVNSFHPLDTVIGKNIFENKYAQLFKSLPASDTTKVKELTSILNELEFNDEIANEYVSFLNSPDFHKTNSYCKSMLLYNCQFVKDPRVLTSIAKLYEFYSDSSLYQANMLEGLAKAKTQKTTDLFLNLITKNPPLLGDPKMVQYLFNALHDSLELCKNFVPKIFSLTKFDEYKTPVYELIGELVNQKLIKPSVYSSYKDEIYREALYEYKRLNSNPALNLNDPKNEGLNMNLVANMYFGIDIPEYNVTKANFISEHIPFVNLVNLLMPFYTKDADVKAFINKLMVNKRQLHVFPVYCSALLNEAFRDKELDEYYMVSSIYRLPFYTFLKHNKIESVPVGDNATIEKLLESDLAMNNFNVYDNQYSKVFDSYIFVDTIRVSNNKEKGKIFIYKNFKLGNFNETWTVMFVNDKLKNGLYDIQFLNQYYVKDSEKENSKIIEEIRTDFYYRYNSRYFSKLLVSSGGQSDGY